MITLTFKDPDCLLTIGNPSEASFSPFRKIQMIFLMLKKYAGTKSQSHMLETIGSIVIYDMHSENKFNGIELSYEIAKALRFMRNKGHYNREGMHVAKGGLSMAIK